MWSQKRAKDCPVTPLYWAFFDRLKTSVRRQWSPNTVYRSHDPRGQVYGVQDRLTILKVTLNGDGNFIIFLNRPIINQGLYGSQIKIFYLYLIYL